MNDNLATAVADFLAHKRALGRKYRTEEATLRLLLAFADQHEVENLRQLTPACSTSSSPPGPGNAPAASTTSSGPSAASSTGPSPSSAWKPRRCTGSGDGRPIGGCPSSSTPPTPASCSRRPRHFPTTRGPPDAGRPTTRIFALCYGLGLRAGEACGLRLGDVDADRQLLVVRGGKFGKSRLVPHGPRIGELLARQLERRRVEGAQEPDAPLFTFDGRRSVHPGSASQTFHRLVAELAFPVPDGVAPPHLHCLRHSFAVGCLLRWYREGLDPSTRLYQLSTFMGHVDPASTAIYLTITPQLLAEANRRFEAFAEPAWSEAKP